ncbi:hypothetical protein BH18ACT10_BH18ACT10_12280 [soil metagenome]
MPQEEVEISFSQGALTVQRARTGEPAAAESYSRERYYGHFRRRIKLPEGVGGNDITAHFENGLLEITVKGGVDRQEPQQIHIRNHTSA